ncbi:MAG: DNA adenine methylase [Taibaiella sp.]|jgi:DNA adenine methylase
MFYSPLRYPGGKNKLSSFIAKICVDNKIHGHYVEPFAGGASVALFLLLEGYVSKITINDKDRSIYAFWYCVLNRTNELCNLINETEVNLENWKVQREIQKRKKNASLLSLGFSTLFLNRTNRSGIIKGGVIGGNEQQGAYKIDCRFNKNEIIERIRLIAKNKKFITIHNLDAIDLIDTIQPAVDPNTIFYFDPPYYLKAESLYMNHFKDVHHQEISDKIKAIANVHWIVSYDDHEFIANLYKGNPTKRYSFNHSAFSARQGKEILVFSPRLKQPDISEYLPTGFKTKRSGIKREIVYHP